MTPRRWIFCGALLGGLGVALGAFGAHGLKEGGDERFGWTPDEAARRIAIYETAVRYQMYHAPALMLVGLLGLSVASTRLRIAGWAFLLGIVIFSGLLYVLTFSGPDWKWLGMVVPIGGVSLIIGWLTLAAASLGAKSNSTPDE